MSLETWEAEFYPTQAYSPEAQSKPIYHSLRKWIGLKKKNREKHGMRLDLIGRDIEITDEHGYHFWVDDDSCSLCRVSLECEKCPLGKAFGRCNRSVEGNAGWREYCETGEPEEMIRQLAHLYHNSDE